MTNTDITDMTLEDFDLTHQEEGYGLELSSHNQFQQFYISDDPPTCDQWCLPILAGLDKNQKVREWQIYFNVDRLLIHHGLRNMKKQVDMRLITLNTSGRNLHQQGWLEACERYNKMLRNGYRTIGESLSGIFKPMRATIYSSSTNILWPVFCDWKLDGHRYDISRENGKIVGRSRSGIVMNSMDYLNDQLNVLFDILPPGSIIDSELYTHGLSFEEISSIIRTRVEVHPRIGEVNINIFDICWDRTTPFERRRHYLERSLIMFYDRLHIPYSTTQPITVYSANPVTNIVEPIQIGCNIESPCQIKLVSGWLIYNTDQLTTMMNMSVRPLEEDVPAILQLDRGYEGIMIKRLSNGTTCTSQQYRMSSYHYGRCSHIYKYKPTSDMDGICINVEDSTGREAGCAILIVKLRNDKSVKLRMKGSLESRREMLSNPSLVIGKIITFKYHRLSEYGIPIHAIGMRIRTDITAQQFYSNS